MQDEVTQADWRQIASAAGRLGIRYRTNTALMQFLVEIAPYYRHQAEREPLARKASVIRRCAYGGCPMPEWCDRSRCEAPAPEAGQ